MPKSFSIAGALVWFLLLNPFGLFSQVDNRPKPSTKWFEQISVRGYTQVRYNGLGVSNPSLGCEQCDRSWGGNNGFFIRRMRLIFFGQINPRVYFYIQPDFASSPASDRLHFGQLRDAYFDVGLNNSNSWRVRIGQSKVPYGFENMQSSQNRLPLDRADGMNSAVANERDLGVFLYWAPVSKRAAFSDLIRKGLKGSGDYGVFAFGTYNGQTANQPELNSNRHVVGRFTWPFQLGNQWIETSLQGYTGRYTLASNQLSSGVRGLADWTYLDQRAAGTFVWYPQPFGMVAEWNIGRGPEYNPLSDSIEVQGLHGGYIQAMYRIQKEESSLIPFVRYQFYDGGKKQERDARSYTVSELELGVEWALSKQFELVVMHTWSDRRYEDHAKPMNQQSGRLIRIQAQVNF
jgi:hypothetical protein